jgi:hypothetical protein
VGLTHFSARRPEPLLPSPCVTPQARAVPWCSGGCRVVASEHECVWKTAELRPSLSVSLCNLASGVAEFFWAILDLQFLAAVASGSLCPLSPLIVPCPCGPDDGYCGRSWP